MKLRGTLGKIKRRLLSRHLWFVRLTLLASVILVLWGMFVLLKSILAPTALGNYLSMARVFLLPQAGLVEQTDNKTNILLLGIAGDGEKNPFVTDTMIVASINRQDGKVSLISIPRDIWVVNLDDKINGAYLIGNKKASGGGIILAKSVVEEVTGLPIHYALGINFEGFVKVVDVLGGVKVNVERAFVDARFPIVGREDDDCGGDPEFLCRYETVAFDAGVQLMDGQTALKFARSRHSTDPTEGNDLARAARQQKIIVAIKDTVVTPQVLLSPTKLLTLWKTFKEITETDLSDQELSQVVRMLVDARGNMVSQVIPEELLFNPPYSTDYKGLYVFVPRSGNWEEVHAWVEGVVGD